MQSQKQQLVQLYQNYLLKIKYHENVFYLQLEVFTTPVLALYEATIEYPNLHIYECFRSKDKYEVRTLPTVEVKVKTREGQMSLPIILSKKKMAEKVTVMAEVVANKLCQYGTEDKSEMKKCKKFLTKQIQKNTEYREKQEQRYKRVNEVARHFNELVLDYKKIKRILTGFQDIGDMGDRDPDYLELDSDREQAKDLQAQLQRRNAEIQQQLPIFTNSKYYTKFSRLKNTIKYSSQEHEFTQILFKRQIPFNQPYQFHIEVSESRTGKIMIGVVPTNRLDRRRSYDSGFAVAYYGHMGWICDTDTPSEYETQGSGFKEGDTVTVNVELFKGFIEWRVNGTTQANTQTPILKDRRSTFVPYLQMYEKGDSCKWMGDWINNRSHRLCEL